VRGEGRGEGAVFASLSLLGAAMMQASRFADSRGVFAGIVEIAMIGYVLVKLMAALRRRVLAWHEGG
jgi:ABC-type nitrate/sulfonate/bicarbonate transport system permease component